MTSKTEPRRLRADAARNRQALVEAAQRLFATRGLSVTLDDIAAEAGVNVATAYRHFANKHELAGAFLQQMLDQVIALAEEAADDEDPWRGLVRLMEGTLDLVADNRGLHDVIVPGSHPEWFESFDARVEPVVEDLLARGRRAGVVRADVRMGDLGVLLQMLALLSDIPVDDQPTLLRRYLAVVLDGLRPSRGTLPGTTPAPATVRAAGAGRGRTGPPSAG